LQKFDLAIDDATTGLHMVSRYIEALQCSEALGMSEERLRTKIAGAWECKAKLCFFRSQSTQSKEDFSGALLDARACWALWNSNGPIESRLQQETGWLMIVGILARMKKGLPRPHWTAHEYRAWCKELHIGDYSLKKHMCSNCGLFPSSSVQLLRCGVCRSTWFCGTACLRESWPDHKEMCKQLKPTAISIICVNYKEAEVRDSIANDGHYGVTDSTKHNAFALLYDPQTGEIFDSLSDRRVIFQMD
jgi:hypothetical protein